MICLDQSLSFLLLFFNRLKEETSALMKDRDHIQYKLEKNVIFQQYLEKVLESAEEVLRTLILFTIISITKSIML